MLVALAFCNSDAAQANSLLSWVLQLGGCPEHSLILIADGAVQWNVCLDMIALGNKAFKTAGLITTKESIIGWPKGSNALWKLCAQHCKDYHQSFLWLEPDCVPLRKGWIDEIQRAVNASTKPFLGRIYASTDQGVPPRMMSGIGVYPENAIDLVGNACDTDKAWDVAMANIVVPLATDSRLIHHFWGQPNLAPTFAAVRTQASPINTFTMEMIDSQACLFHRCKNDSLIKLLRKRMFPEIPEERSSKFEVILPFCATDAELALVNIQWMRDIKKVNGTQERYDHGIILAIDDKSRLVREILETAKECFSSVIIFKYPVPPVEGHPQAANWAFKHTANYMQERGKPWLWMEADMFCLKPEWLDILQAEYDACGKPCMGPIVKDMSHANGTCVYCPDLPARCPRFMEHPDGHWAFDMVIKDELIPMIHDCSHLMQLAWCMVSGQMLPYGHGELPEFRHKASLGQLWPSAMTFHRCKNESLVSRLREFYGKT